MPNLSRKKPVILIVDDDPLIIKSLSEIVGEEYKILATTSGLKGIDIAILKKDDIDLILLDINMPEIDGYGVCRKLKSISVTENIPIVFITASNDITDEEKGFLLGASDYIHKPFSSSILKVRIRNQIMSKEYMDFLRDSAYEDPLTGIANRRTYDEKINILFKQAIRKNKSIGLIMCDIDYFKNYNDFYGHGAGDECLTAVAKAISKSVQRPLDIVARYGGEEFTVILYDITLEGLSQVHKRIMDNIEKLSIPHEKSTVSNIVTISSGSVFLFPKYGSSIEDFCKEADNSLYHVKNSGRNNFYVNDLS